MKHTLSLPNRPRPLSQETRERRLRQIPICQITAQLIGETISQSMEEARNQSLAWLQNRSGRLPQTAWAHLSFENPTPGRQAQAVRLDTPVVDYWCARLDDNDKSVAGRVWTTELSVAHKKSTNRAIFGLRQMMTTPEDEPEFIRALPGVVRQVSERPGLLRDGRTVSKQPLYVSTELEVDRLIELIETDSRIMPVYVLSLGDGESNIDRTLVEPSEFAQRCAGIAHVAVITGPASYHLTDRLGKALSVFNRAVRTYRSGFDTTNSPFDHPLALPHRISNWRDIGPPAFADFLVDRAALESLRFGRSDADFPRYSSVKQTELQLARQATEQTEEKALSIAADEIDTLKVEVEEWQSLCEAAAVEAEKFERQVRDLEGQNAYLRARISGLEKEVASSSGQPEDRQIPLPKTLDELRPWVEENLAGRVLLTGKAARAAKGSSFRNTALVYKAVQFLGTEYREMRIIGDSASLKAYHAKLADLGLEDSLSGDETRLRQQADEFYVIHGDRKHFLKNHLKRGNARDRRYCFRCYYFWDDETEQVVIGSLPGHLRTGIS